MTDTLVERLRAVDVSWSETGEWCAEAADRIIVLEADVARLREALELLLARSEVVRVLAAEQAEKMPSRLSWLADMDLFYEAQRKARAEIARASVVLAALEADHAE